MTVYRADHDVTVHHGHVLDVLPLLDAGSVQCVVTSPPYFGLRDYGVAGQLGLEASPAEYVESMRAVFAEVRRVLADDGTLWVNLGDSYSAGGRSSYDTNGGKTRARGHAAQRPVSALPDKNLLGVPWRVAFALQDDGWILRNAVIWAKPNAMPESVTDRLSTRYEHVFLFSKSRRYWFDLDPIREPAVQIGRVRADKVGGNKGDITAHSPGSVFTGSETRNPGDVWTMTTQPFAGAHFATMSPKLVRRCVLAGCPAGGTVLDPFAGSGTTLMVARQLGRRSVGIEINGDFLPIIDGRLGDDVLEFGASPASPVGLEERPCSGCEDLVLSLSSDGLCDGCVAEAVSS